MNQKLTLMPVFSMWIVVQSLALRNEMRPTFKNLYKLTVRKSGLLHRDGRKVILGQQVRLAGDRVERSRER